MKAMSPTLGTCYAYLKKTSRSFAAVIQALDGDIRNAVCIFYLVLRALDTVEDDMTIPNDVKIPMLESFHKNLKDPNWRFLDSKEKDKIVLEDFPTISYEFRQLDECYQTVISDICMKMGKGMTVFLDRDIETVEEWNQYCHYVAGLVGIGLSQLFAASELEDEVVGKDTDLANRMGLFLQKTNIIRDYLEDVRDGREFWPKEIWSKHAKKLSDLADEDKRKNALLCLNELITNALELVPDCIKYMSRLHNQSVFNFCAIPQVMAIATLERCYNNPSVFTGVVKIRKGEAVKMMMESTSLGKVKSIMHHFSSEILMRVPLDDPIGPETRRQCLLVLEHSATKQEFHSSSVFLPIYVSCAMMVTAIAYNYWSQVEVWYRSYYEQ
ncbi:squalene synthase-like isoform X2 [Gigantopelta aegis]|uniref:squalene synthase-like isoform X2 n=1 Tax=Gigantopelta aegis TaxID=1735272 RepID=UPI001B887D0B|nr:squalene synthase-like isoform X2 [Gigantopelta aegis]